MQRTLDDWKRDSKVILMATRRCPDEHRSVPRPSTGEMVAVLDPPCSRCLTEDAVAAMLHHMGDT